MNTISFPSQLTRVQAANEDFEWYPTTDEIIAALLADITATDDPERRWRSNFSFLDIGAGNGKVLKAVAELDQIGDLLAIEKSRALTAILPEKVLLLGVDFNNTTLIDKDPDIIFSNPPYSEFNEWMIKIISECQPETTIYLVVPQRWKDDRLITESITRREAESEIIGSFDFIEAQERKARAKVDLLRITLPTIRKAGDPFTQFFDDTFNYPEPPEPSGKTSAEYFDEIVQRTNFIEALCVLYDRRMAHLNKAFTAICTIPEDVLREFELSRSALTEALKMRLANAKKEYWKRLFDGMEELYRRLTTKSRNDMANLLNSRTGIDFNRENAYEIVLWAVRNANSYFDAQLIAVYENMVDHANVENYVSNQRVFKRDRFRYDAMRAEDFSHYRLRVGHRIVLQWCGGLERNYSNQSTLSRQTIEFISDIATVANNLDFKVHPTFRASLDNITDSTAFECHYTKDGITHTLFRCRAFHNRNLHFQFDPDFIHALNIHHGRLKGWLRNDSEAATELEIPAEIASKHFNLSMRITAESLAITGSQPQPEPDTQPDTELFQDEIALT